MNSVPLPTLYALPWDSSAEADQLYGRIRLIALAVLLLLSIALPLLPLPEILTSTAEEPPILTRVVLEKKTLPEPPPPPVQPKPEQRIVQPEARPVVKPEVKPKPRPEPVDHLARARDAAAAAGVLAFQDDLAALRDTVDVQALDQTRTSRGRSDAAQVQRAVVTRQGPADSGGIQVAKLSTDAGGPALSGRETTAVQSKIAGSPRAGAGKSASHSLGGRSDDDIRRVMDKNKGAIFALYNRALRRNPLLEGKVVFEMVIDPEGGISELNLLSSELEDEELTRRILGRINLITFGPDEVLSTRVNYSFDFLPYT